MLKGIKLGAIGFNPHAVVDFTTHHTQYLGGCVPNKATA